MILWAFFHSVLHNCTSDCVCRFSMMFKNTDADIIRIRIYSTDTDTDFFYFKIRDTDPDSDTVFSLRIRIQIWANTYPFDTPTPISHFLYLKI